MELNKLNTVINIIKRDDYARMTKDLKEKAEALAKKFRLKMSELDIDELYIDNIYYKIGSANYKDVDEYNYLSVVKEEKRETDSGRYEYYDELYSLEDIGRDYLYRGDWNCRVIGATNKDALRFINSANEFIQTLGEIEEEQVNEVNKVLSIADEIIASN